MNRSLPLNVCRAGLTPAEVEELCRKFQSDKTDDAMSVADQHFGFTFGVDGLMSYEQACEFLGGISVSTLKRLLEDGPIRRGRHPHGRRVVVCRRSVMNYIADMEL